MTDHVIRMGPELSLLIKRQLKAFRKKFHRDPGPDDPIFFDPRYDDPRPMDPDWLEAEVVEAFKKAGVHPAIIYAYKKTGLMPPQSGGADWPEDRLAEWQAAVDEYLCSH